MRLTTKRIDMAEITILRRGTEAKCYVDIKNVTMEDIRLQGGVDLWLPSHDH